MKWYTSFEATKKINEMSQPFGTLKNCWFLRYYSSTHRFGACLVVVPWNHLIFWCLKLVLIAMSSPACSQIKGVYTPKGFIHHEMSLGQTFVHCQRFSTAASRRSMARHILSIITYGTDYTFIPAKRGASILFRLLQNFYVSRNPDI